MEDDGARARRELAQARRRAKRLFTLALGAERLTKLYRHTPPIQTLDAFLTLTNLQIMQLLDEPLHEVKRMLARLDRRIMPYATKRRTALQMYRARRRPGAVEEVPTGLAAIDAALHGGVPVGSVTELVGPAGALDDPFLQILHDVEGRSVHLQHQQ